MSLIDPEEWNKIGRALTGAQIERSVAKYCDKVSMDKYKKLSYEWASYSVDRNIEIKEELERLQVL